MSAPKIKEAKTVGGNAIALVFDQPLDENSPYPGVFIHGELWTVTDHLGCVLVQ